MDSRIVSLEYRIAECDINLLQDRKKALVKHPPVDVRGDRFLWQRYKVEGGRGGGCCVSRGD